MASLDSTDRQAITDLVLGYAAAADDRDVTAFVALFLPDATLTARRGSGPGATYVGADRLAEIPARLSRYVETFHVVTNIRAEPGADGDAAIGRSQCRAHHITAEGETATDQVLTIRYRDTYRRTDAGWRIATRDVHILWSEDVSVTRPD